MGLQNKFDSLRMKLAQRGDHSVNHAMFTLLDRFMYSSSAPTGSGPHSSGPHIRDSANVQRLMNYFVLATLPCWIIGMWNLGYQSNLAMAQIGMTSASGWQGWMFDQLNLGHNPADFFACFIYGLLYFLPIFFVALLTGAIWDSVFATLRRKPVDEGLFAIAWLYAMILPATAPLYQVALGMTFGLVVGKAIYGGTGRYLINPAVLALAFHVFSYPGELFGIGAWIPVPNYDQPTTLELAVEEGGISVIEAVGYQWSELFIGIQPGAMGITSVLGVILGALFLVFVGAASWRIIIGAVLGLIAGVQVLNMFGPAADPMYAMPWYWHMVIGGVAFGIVFIATDAVPAAITNTGRWIFGGLVGLLTVVVRVTNPSFYEGVIFAILLASVFAPLIDYAVIELHIRKRKRRLQESAV